MAKQPLAEVFGFPISNQSGDASRYRTNNLCPFHNKVPNCTKDKANAPLGVCSVLHDGQAVITCPIRFREEWLIAEDAAGFFFPPQTTWTSLAEVRLKDADGLAAGNIDLVLVSYDSQGRLTDFGALEVQAVYISGNIRNPFERYMSDPASHSQMDWSQERNYPHPDFLSSSRKRLAPQLLFKGGIINAWKKKSAVALDLAFYNTLPVLNEVGKSKAEMAWFVYDLVLDPSSNRYVLTRVKTVYTKFSDTLQQITVAKPGKVKDFVQVLQEKLDEKLDNSTPPINVTLEDLL
jgi:Restriction endonuclease NotI